MDIKLIIVEDDKIIFNQYALLNDEVVLDCEFNDAALECYGIVNDINEYDFDDSDFLDPMAVYGNRLYYLVPVDKLIKFYRQFNGMSQQDLADKTEISVGMIRKYDQYQVATDKIASGTLALISDALGCTIYDLI